MRNSVFKLLLESLKKKFPDYKSELEDGFRMVLGAAMWIGAIAVLGWIIESKEAKDIGLFLLLVVGNAAEELPGWGWMGLFFAIVFWLVARRNRQRQEIIISLLSEIRRKLP